MLQLRGRDVMFQDKTLNAGIEDDHIPFKNKDVPILHLITYPFPSVSSGVFLIVLRRLYWRLTAI